MVQRGSKILKAGLGIFTRGGLYLRGFLFRLFSRLLLTDRRLFGLYRRLLLTDRRLFGLILLRLDAVDVLQVAFEVSFGLEGAGAARLVASMTHKKLLFYEAGLLNALGRAAYSSPAQVFNWFNQTKKACGLSRYTMNAPGLDSVKATYYYLLSDSLKR